MTTDRELLELAAKAAGFEVYEFQPDVPKGLWVKYEGKSFVWMPYIDDGDALRLAVKLRIDVNQSVGIVVAERLTPFDEIGVAESFTDDPYAATRRAIVRAAAEIGRNMK